MPNLEMICLVSINEKRGVKTISAVVFDKIWFRFACKNGDKIIPINPRRVLGIIPKLLIGIIKLKKNPIQMRPIK